MCTTARLDVYGTVRCGQDAIVELDVSIVWGNTFKNAILRTLDKMGPTKIIVTMIWDPSCPKSSWCQAAHRFAIPMSMAVTRRNLGIWQPSKLGLMKDRGVEHILDEVYKLCREELKTALRQGHTVNPVQKIYEPFTPQEISFRIAKDLKLDCKASVHVLYQGVEDLHRAFPDSGDWYFTGDYHLEGLESAAVPLRYGWAPNDAVLVSALLCPRRIAQSWFWAAVAESMLWPGSLAKAPRSVSCLWLRAMVALATLMVKLNHLTHPPWMWICKSKARISLISSAFVSNIM